MKLTTLLAAIGGALCLTSSVFAQPAGQSNYTWSGGGDDITWSQPANWAGGVVPPNDGTTWAIFAEAGYPAANTTPIVIAPTDVVQLNDALFGPTWGQTLNIQGSVSAGFGMFTWGDNFTGVSTINIQTNGSLSLNDTLAFGVAWWFPGGPNVAMNVYSNAFLGVNWFQFGGRLNMFGGTVSVTNGLNTGTPTTPVFAGGIDSDATRSINLMNQGKLVLPGFYTATVNDWITRNILLVYGVPGDSAQIVIDEANVDWPGRTVVTTTATAPSPMQAIHIQVPRTNMAVGGLQQAQVLADYSTSSNVNVTATTSVVKTYQSSAASVATINANGQVRAVGSGTATLSVIVGSFTNTVVLTVGVYTNAASLAHRYSFGETSGSTAADSIGGPTWDATLFNGGATFDAGQLVLNGVDGYVQLPAGILTNLDAVTIETWASFTTIPNWAVLFTFGDTDGIIGNHYISFQPHTGVTTAQSGIKNATMEQNPAFTPVLDNYTNVHIVAVFHPEAGYCSIYTNGVLAAINNNITITLADAFSTGVPLNYLGRSLYSADPPLAVLMDEFRIHHGPLTLGQIEGSAALGPNQLVGATTSVSLTATRSGSNIVLTWPTTAALVDLLSSPALGTGALWTSVAGVPAVVGGNYQVTIPASGAARFFRLQK